METTESKQAAAATKIQAVYRSHLVRALIRRILAVDSEASRLEALIREQDTVDAVRRDAKERIRMNEGLMALLLRLDSIGGFYPAVRGLRRSVGRRIVGLQEVLDAITEESIVGLEWLPDTWEDLVYGETPVVGVDEDDECGYYGCLQIQRFLSEF